MLLETVWQILPYAEHILKRAAYLFDFLHCMVSSAIIFYLHRLRCVFKFTNLSSVFNLKVFMLSLLSLSRLQLVASRRHFLQINFLTNPQATFAACPLWHSSQSPIVALKLTKSECVTWENPLLHFAHTTAISPRRVSDIF